MAHDDVKLDSRGLNSALSAVALSDEKMRELGFTDHSEKNWYYGKSVANDITFNLTIPKNGGRLRIDVLDEDFGQPYDYQALLERKPVLKYAQDVKQGVEYHMGLLRDAGIIHGYEVGMYI